MRFPAPRSRARQESVVPMINVVFLLLIFFMISSELAPAPPFDVTPPEAGAFDAGADRADDTLYVDASGRIAWRGLRDEAALQALGVRGDAPLEIRADAALPARAAAALLARLAAAGIADVRLATRPAASSDAAP
ncbi:ExbD/TolR family protein [Palleronia sp. KMU-117]|uniref:ExbD/TolR family protein n=1 Tax=Palleronia sp. KMU-117 TaxID=3434108 RepID=UPI003D749FA8